MAKKAKRLAPLPRVTSKTITVGALLGKIKRLILAEPKRLNMDAWIHVFRGELVQVEDNIGPDQPACGTVCCMAGWGATLLRPERARGRVLANMSSVIMRQAVGFRRPVSGERSVGGLFNARPCPEFEGEAGLGRLPDAGTAEHAAVIAKRIDTYLAQHPEIVNRKIIVADVQKALSA